LKKRKRVVSQEERERALIRQRAARATPEGWSRQTLRNCINKARRLGHESDLTLDDLTIPAVCPALGIPLVLGLQGKSTAGRPNAPSVDRIDSTLGYVKGNVRVISLRANILKRDATLAELEGLVAYVRDALLI
jgi:hypothetical protein